MICVDVHYTEDAAFVGLVHFTAYVDAEPYLLHRVEVPGAPEPYTPGQFWRRELPPVHAALKLVGAPPEVLFVDALVDLGEGRPGFGRRLWEERGCLGTVVGVAKTQFVDSGALPVTRRGSRVPLFVSSTDGRNNHWGWVVQGMAGNFRIPKLMKLADQVARGIYQKGVTAKVLPG